MQQALAPAPHPMQNAPQESDQVLREHLLAQVHTPQSSGPHSMDNLRPSSSASPNDHNIDPAIAGSAQQGMGSDSGDDGDSSGKKGAKRELSTSKRAAQNRAAQRAFRQRKEGYIKKLEAQVHDLHALEDSYKQVQAENYQLRDYIINLQSRLIESQGDYPPAPAEIDLPRPHKDGPTGAAASHAGPAPTAPMTSPAMSQLQSQATAAQSQAQMNAENRKHPHDGSGFVAANSNSPNKRMRGSGGLPISVPRLAGDSA